MKALFLATLLSLTAPVYSQTLCGDSDPRRAFISLTPEARRQQAPFEGLETVFSAFQGFVRRKFDPAATTKQTEFQKYWSDFDLAGVYSSLDTPYSGGRKQTFTGRYINNSVFFQSGALAISDSERVTMEVDYRISPKEPNGNKLYLTRYSLDFPAAQMNVTAFHDIVTSIVNRLSGVAVTQPPSFQLKARVVQPRLNESDSRIFAYLYRYFLQSISAYSELYVFYRLTSPQQSPKVGIDLSAVRNRAGLAKNYPDLLKTVDSAARAKLAVVQSGFYSGEKKFLDYAYSSRDSEWRIKTDLTSGGFAAGNETFSPTSCGARFTQMIDIGLNPEDMEISAEGLRIDWKTTCSNGAWVMEGKITNAPLLTLKGRETIRWLVDAAIPGTVEGHAKDFLKELASSDGHEPFTIRLGLSRPGATTRLRFEILAPLVSNTFMRLIQKQALKSLGPSRAAAMKDVSAIQTRMISALKSDLKRNCKSL